MAEVADSKLVTADAVSDGGRMDIARSVSWPVPGVLDSLGCSPLVWFAPRRLGSPSDKGFWLLFLFTRVRSTLDFQRTSPLMIRQGLVEGTIFERIFIWSFGGPIEDTVFHPHTRAPFGYGAANRIRASSSPLPSMQGQGARTHILDLCSGEFLVWD